MVMTESGIARVLADFICDLDQMLKYEVGVLRYVLSTDNQYSHNTSHQELILCNLFRSGALLNEAEELSEKLCGCWTYFLLWEHWSTFILQIEDSFGGDGGVSIGDIIRGR